jgi:hypothetical protein
VSASSFHGSWACEGCTTKISRGSEKLYETVSPDNLLLTTWGHPTSLPLLCSARPLPVSPLPNNPRAAEAAGALSVLIGMGCLPQSSPTTPVWLPGLSLVLVTVTAIFSCLSLIVLYKIVQVKEQPLTALEFIGGVGRTVERLEPGVDGYVQYRGEY